MMILPRDDMLARYMPSSCVCLCVCLSQVALLLKRLNVGSRKHFVCELISAWSFNQLCRTKKTFDGSSCRQHGVVTNGFFSEGAAIRIEIVLEIVH